MMRNDFFIAKGQVDIIVTVAGISYEYINIKESKPD